MCLMLVRKTEETLSFLHFIHILYSHCTYLLHQYSRLCLKEHFISQQVRDFLPGVYMVDDSQDEALLRKVDNLDQTTCYSCQKHIFQSVCSALIMFTCSFFCFAFVF